MCLVDSCAEDCSHGVLLGTSPRARVPQRRLAPRQTGWKVVRLDFWAKLPPTHAKVLGSSVAQAFWTAEPVIISGVTDTQLL